MTNRKYLLLCIAFIFFAGCAGTAKKSALKKPNVNRLRGSRLPFYEPPKPAEGSLWSEVAEVSLFPDLRARKKGDIVTVRIVEDPEASLNANTDTSRSSSVDAAKLKFLGYMQALAEKNPRLAQNPGEDDLILASLGLKHTGKGTSDRDGHIKAYISAVVEEVLPNGNLFVNGRR